MRVLVKALAVAGLCVCSVLAQLPKETRDLKVGKLFGAMGVEIDSDEDLPFQPLGVWAVGTIKVDTFGVVLHEVIALPIYKYHGNIPKGDEILALQDDEHVTRVECGFDGGGMIYLKLITSKLGQDNYRSVSAGTAPITPSGDMIEVAPAGKELSGFVTFKTEGKIVGVSVIWTTIRNIPH